MKNRLGLRRSFLHISTTYSLFVLIACQSASPPLNTSPSSQTNSQKKDLLSTGFRIASLIDPFSLPFQTQSFPANSTITFSDGKVDSWSQNFSSQSFKLSRNASGNLIIDVGVGVWPGGPDSYGLSFKLDFGNVVLEQDTPYTAQVGSDSERTMSNYGTTVHHRFLTGSAVMQLKGNTLEIKIQGLSSGN